MVAIAGTDRNGRTDVSWLDFEDLRKNCRLAESFIAEHISGTVGPQTFTITVTKGGPHGSVAPGSTVTVTIGGTGQTVRATVGGCTSSNGTTTALTVRSVDLKSGNGEPGDHHETTTTATTTTTHS